MYKVTIATPLYNSEKFIEATLISALKQTFIDIEFLIIDDRGTDRSISIVENLQQNHLKGKDIRIITHDHNKGVAAARNTAIDEAEGEYLFFLDSDDLLSPDCIEQLYTLAVTHDAEIVIGSHQTIHENGKIEKETRLPTLNLKGKHALSSFIYQSKSQRLPFYIWNMLMKVSFIKKHQLRFHLIKIGEDVVFYQDMMPLVNSCVLYSEITYLYVKRENSLSQFNVRDQITLEEIRTQMYYRNYKKKKYMELKSEPYADNMAIQTMKDCFNAAISIVKKWNIITPTLPDTEFKILLACPYSFQTSLSFNKGRIAGVAFWLLGKLPCNVSRLLLQTYINLKHH